MPELKRLSPDAVAGAMDKAERYRVLNEPEEAESICRDVLAIDPANQHALATLLLALTDQFGRRLLDSFESAVALLPELTSEYERTYYEGVIYERRAKAELHERAAGGAATARSWLEKAMACFETAQAIRPPGNDNALLRWNSCMRSIDKHNLTPRENPVETPLE